jgi:hypothetical protein
MVIKTEAALGELHHYHRFGRHLSVFPQKLYFLFSHCAHLLFSLWLAEQDSPVKVFAESPGLTVLFNNVDFGALRYTDYSRRMLYADAYEQHLKNEPKWFKFWIRLLQELQGSEASGFEDFSRKLCACLGDTGLLDGKVSRRDQKTLTALVQGPRAGRLLLHSIWILEDVISTASAHVFRLDPAICAVEQIQLMICLFSQLRRAIVWETTAQGPHTLAADWGWSEPSALDRLLGRKVPGLLTITPAPEGGQVACTHAWQADSKPCERKWVRSIAALPCPYEELLFKTWPQETPKQSAEGETPAPSQAHWAVHSIEAGHLESVAGHADKLLERLGCCPAYSRFVETVACVLRNGRTEWTATELPWDYVRRLDQLIAKLKFACREAKVVGGQNPAEKVIANLWPPQYRQAQVTDAPLPAKPVIEESYSPEPQVRPEEQIVEIVPPAECEQAAPLRSPPVQVELPEPADGLPPADDILQDREPQVKLPDEPEPVDIESLLQPECRTPQDRADQPPIQDKQDLEPPDRLAQLIALLLEEDARDDSAAGPHPVTHVEPIDVADRSALQSLAWRLLDWHRPPTEGADREPLSLVQLQQDLGWDQAKVLQAMTALFGAKPFTLYGQKCMEKSIRGYLEEFSSARSKGRGADAPVLCLSAGCIAER